MHEDTILCTCNNVSEQKINDEIVNNKLTTESQVAHLTNAGSVCGGCSAEIEELLNRLNREVRE